MSENEMNEKNNIDPQHFENITEKRFVDEMKNSYLLCSMSGLISRAIPDARYGFKPVQRRILYGMNELGLKHNTSYKKCARIVGEVMGKYHPHGDGSIYDALVRMAQDFSMRYMLVDGQGNFGSIDRDPAAAMRYTEAKMQSMSEYMLNDLDKDTVNFVDNFDGSLKEPEVLPARLPNLLMNGASGIAVGMATNIPPHNLGELVKGFKYLIENPDCQTSELMQFIKGPDFPTGGIIVDAENILSMYETGRGKFTVRGRYEIAEDKSGQAIVVTEIPYNVSKVDIIEQIVAYAERMRDNKQDSGIRDIRDESDRHGMRLVIELKRNANVNKLTNDLLKHTSLQTTFAVQMNVVYNRKPVMMTLKEIMNTFVEHRVDVVTRRTQYELNKARKRAHIVEGLIKAVQGIDTVIDVIRNSESDEAIISNLMSIIGVTEEQAKAIADLKLKSLSKLEINKFRQELEQLNIEISRCIKVLQDRSSLMQIIESEFDEVDQKFGDERKTEIIYRKYELKSPEELIEDQEVVVVLTQWGYIKSKNSVEYKLQGMGGKGAKAIKIGDNDTILQVIHTRRLSKLMFITSAGKAYQIPTYEIDMSSKDTKGVHIANYLSMQEGEKIKTIVSISLDGDYDKDVMIFTKKGKVKKTSLREFANSKRSGVRAVSLNEDDAVVDSIIVEKEEGKILTVTKHGMAICFNISDVRLMGRTAIGVNAMKIRKDDEIVNAVLIEDSKKLLIMTQNGYAKRESFDEYRIQIRGGIGVKTLKNIKKIGPIVSAIAVSDDNHLLAFTTNGKAIRFSVDSIPVLSRVTQGVIALRLDENDTTMGLAIVKEEEELLKEE